MNLVNLSTLELFAAAIGAMGALLLASRSAAAAWGWVLFVLSNVAWIAYALQTHQTGLLLMQAVFLGTSLLGVWRWLVKPAIDDRWVGWPR